METYRQISRRDVRLGRIEPKVIENGVIVPPMAQVNCLTLDEHQRRLELLRMRPLSREEALQIGYDPTEVAEHFGS
jgi:hypothetical protein